MVVAQVTLTEPSSRHLTGAFSEVRAGSTHLAEGYYKPTTFIAFFNTTDRSPREPIHFQITH